MFERRSTARRRQLEAVNRVVAAFALSEASAARRLGGEIPAARIDYRMALHYADGDPIITGLIKTRAANTVREVSGDNEALLDESHGLLGEARVHLEAAGDSLVAELARVAMDVQKYNVRRQAYDIRNAQEATTVDMHGIDTTSSQITEINGFPLRTPLNDDGALYLVEPLGGEEPPDKIPLPEPDKQYGWTPDEAEPGWLAPQEDLDERTDELRQSA